MLTRAMAINIIIIARENWWTVLMALFLTISPKGAVRNYRLNRLALKKLVLDINTAWKQKELISLERAKSDFQWPLCK